MIRFTIYGKPLPKRRHRSRYVLNKNPAKKGFVMMYQDKSAVAEENLIRTEALKVRPEVLLQGSIELVVCCYFIIPKDTSKKKVALMLSDDIRPTKKPDLDNIVKAILDACNKIIWRDDSQVVTIIARKYYGEVPRTIVRITEIK